MRPHASFVINRGLMQDFSQSFGSAFALLLSGDPTLWGIVALSLQVSVAAVLIAAAIGIPLGAFLGASRFPGRGAIVVVLDALMGLPPVVVGLTIYMLISNAGPLGALRLLYTPEAMILAQAVLVTPIVAALTRQVTEDCHRDYAELFRSLVVPKRQAIIAIVMDCRHALLTVVLAGFGRAVAEVGAVLLVGGNIANVTRVMTTAIALETAKGELALALGLGSVLLLIALSVNAALALLRRSIASEAQA